MRTKLLLISAALLALLAGAVAAAAPQAQGGPHIAYAGADHNIWTIGLDGSARRQLTDDRLSDYPEWASGGSQILFQTQRDNKTLTVMSETIALNQIYIMGSDGSKQQALSSGNTDDKFPDVAESGNAGRFVFIRVGNYRAENGRVMHDTEIGSMTLAGQDYRSLVRLTSDAGTRYDLYPARQSNDGSRIVFVKRTIGASVQLQVLDTASGRVTTVQPALDRGAGEGTVEYLWPRFAPDGDIVVLRRAGAFGPSEVALLRMEADGSNPRALLSGMTYEALAYGFDVDWGAGTVVAARSPELPGGVRAEELYRITLANGEMSAPIDSGHAPALTGRLSAPPVDTPTPAPPTNTPMPGQPTPGPASPTAEPVAPSQPLIETADPLFYRVWERVDRPVMENRAARSWTWGPAPLAAGREPFGTGGRLAQYFDKARMELNEGAPGQAPFVTNGLLVVEMMSGQVQVGPTQYETRAPSTLAIGGDGEANPAPSYSALARVSSLQGENQAEDRVGQGVTASLSASGEVGTTEGISAVRIARFMPETGHNIPNVFWDFLNQRGVVFENGRYGEGQILDWLFTVGYPISEPYWTRIAIDGRDTDVLVQAYQRQLLTYIPSYDPQWQVQFANVGQIYHQWRYGE